MIPGVVLYGARPGPNGVEMGFALWLEGIAWFTLEVKGGRYFLDGGEWFLEEPGGAMPKSSPLMQAWDNVMSLRNSCASAWGAAISPSSSPRWCSPAWNPART